ncbi:hypothetical protein WNZ14_22130 [Hoeflea sp. AS60]
MSLVPSDVTDEQFVALREMFGDLVYETPEHCADLLRYLDEKSDSKKPAN